MFNATNITADRRRRWISLFTEYGARVRIVYLEVPYKEMMKRNGSRTAVVPRSAIHKMIRQLEVPSVREAHHLDFIVP